MDGEIRILVVDDHALVREVITDWLDREPGLNVVATAASADEAVEQALRWNPDVILMDIEMPGLASFGAARHLGSLRPESRIIFLSGFTNERYIEQALEVRAQGYLTKTEPPETLVAAIRLVADGGTYFSDEIRARIVTDEGGTKLAAPSRSRTSLLTSRELEMLRYIAQGLSKKQIAGLLHVSIKTVDRHTANLMAKLEIHDRVELARFAIREGLAEA